MMQQETVYAYLVKEYNLTMSKDRYVKLLRIIKRAIKDIFLSGDYDSIINDDVLNPYLKFRNLFNDITSEFLYDADWYVTKEDEVVLDYFCNDFVEYFDSTLALVEAEIKCLSDSGVCTHDFVDYNQYELRCKKCGKVVAKYYFKFRKR